MIPMGLIQINNVISEDERLEILGKINACNSMNFEGNDPLYANSFGTQGVNLDLIYGRLTEAMMQKTGLKLERQNIYARIYYWDGKLGAHKDREGLELTLSVQIENTFNQDCEIFATGYDQTRHKAILKDRDGLLIKGRELLHWRDKIADPESEGRLVCLFFHWKIVSFEIMEVDNFILKERAAQLISENKHLLKESTVYDGKGGHRPSTNRTSKTAFNISAPDLDQAVKKYVGNLKLENWQLTKYEEGQQFTPHQDCDANSPKRIFTIIVYLNNDFGGGETRFPQTEIMVKPKTGKMVIWKNFKNDAINPEAEHQGLPVTLGEKWILVNFC